VFSERNKGSEFIIGLPINKKVYAQAQIKENKEHQIDFENLQYTIDWIENDTKEMVSNSVKKEKISEDVHDKKRILVVEDNEEMRRFLVNSLSDDYQVFEAENGQVALEIAISQMPDLIVSDLMMPEMDGNQLCKKVREDINISHTPFILISAKASVETHIHGLESGADIYFPKPFSLRLLQVTIQNLFEARAKLKDKYNTDVFADTRELVTNQKEKEFLDELIEIVEYNMENEELDVDMICKKIGMSRTKLYGKVKAVTGQPIGEFIRLLRLKKAARILVSEDVSILDVMMRVGIQSQSYFTKAFKKEFGKTPSAFIAEHTKGSNKPIDKSE
ncbi:MAG: response regulator, partial [Chitinophagaceae bacterium]|nr:response regulator [Chitinophagaceae bacterium]